MTENKEMESVLHGFHGVPFKTELEAMSDIELAELQTTLSKDSPGHRLIENEWQRRNSIQPVPFQTPNHPTDNTQEKTGKEKNWQHSIVLYIAVGVVIVVLGAISVHYVLPLIFP